jgi:hypothetical protein
LKRGAWKASELGPAEPAKVRKRESGRASALAAMLNETIRWLRIQFFSFVVQ